MMKGQRVIPEILAIFMNLPKLICQVLVKIGTTVPTHDDHVGARIIPNDTRNTVHCTNHLATKLREARDDDHLILAGSDATSELVDVELNIHDPFFGPLLENRHLRSVLGL